MQTKSNPGVGASAGSNPSSAEPAPRVAKPTVKDAASPAPEKAVPSLPDTLKLRRQLVWASICALLGASPLMFFRFFFPRTLFQPSTKFPVGFPSDFGPGVDERFKQAPPSSVGLRPDKL